MVVAAAAAPAVPGTMRGSAAYVGKGEAAVATAGRAGTRRRNTAFVEVEEAPAGSVVVTRPRRSASPTEIRGASAATASGMGTNASVVLLRSEGPAGTAALLENEVAAAVTDTLVLTVKARSSASCIGVGGEAATSAVALMAETDATSVGMTEAAAATGALLGTETTAIAHVALAPPMRRRTAACVGTG